MRSRHETGFHLIDKGRCMNRFFSKLDLREIRIDPRSSRFPPGTDERSVAAADDHLAASAGVVTDQPKDSEIAPPVMPRTPYAPAWTASNGAEDDEARYANGSHLTSSDPDASQNHVVQADGAGEDVLKVSARSRPSAVAGAIAGVVRESGRAEVQAIGAGATNQAVKAVAIARDYLQETGIEVICLPAFIDVTIGDEDRTAIRLVIEPR